MKKFILIFLGFILPSVSFAWIPQMQFQFNPRYAQVQMFNNTPFNAFCQGYLYAQTQSGIPANMWVSIWVPAYGFQVAYLYSYGNVFFTSTWANIDCH